MTFAPDTARDLQALTQIWAGLSSISCPSLYNFHLHSVRSDGRLTPTEIVDQTIDQAIKGFAITDHHTVRGYREAQDYLGQLAEAGCCGQGWPRLWTGVEINASLLDVTVHILGYGFEPAHPAISVYLQGGMPAATEVTTAAAVIGAIHRAGGLAVLAHPARYRRAPEVLITAAVPLGLDGVEAYYAYDNPQPWRPSPVQTELVVALGHQHNLWLTCGTDSHGLSLALRR